MNGFDCIKRFAIGGLLVAGPWGCSAPSLSDTTPVTMTFEAPSSDKSTRQSFAAVPSGVASIRIEVSAADIETITDVFNVASGETVTRTLQVPSGPGRIFTAEAYDGPGAAGNALYRGVSAAINLEPGSPAAVSISMLPLVIPATLASIAVTPINPSIALGLTQQFTAIGTYTDNSTQDLTASVAWSSSATGVATINSSGLATTLTVGTATITATDSASGISGSTTLTVTAAPIAVPQISRLSLAKGIIGDTLKMTGSGFGTSQGTNTANIGGLDATTILRWSDTEIAAIIPSGVAVSSAGTLNNVVVTVGGQPSNLASITLYDHTHGVGGELDDGNLDKLILDAATTSVTLEDVPPTFGTAGETSSVVLSGDGNTAAEADHSGYGYGERMLSFDTTSPLVDEPLLMDTQDAAISRDGATVLLTDGSPTLTRLIDFTSTPTALPLTNPADPSGSDCFVEAALSSDGNTAAVVTRTALDGCLFPGAPYKIYRIDNVLSNPAFMLITTTTNSYTDVAMSEDGKTVIAGTIGGGGGNDYAAGVQRIRNFTASPVVETDLAALAASTSAPNDCPPDTVDVDLSADGMTAVVGIVKNVFNFSVCVSEPSWANHVFQIRDADLALAGGAEMPQPSNLEGVAVSAGGAVALIKVSSGTVEVTRLDGFNRAGPTSMNFVLSGFAGPPFFNSSASRNQDQIDLQ